MEQELTLVYMKENFHNYQKNLAKSNPLVQLRYVVFGIKPEIEIEFKKYICQISNTPLDSPDYQERSKLHGEIKLFLAQNKTLRGRNFTIEELCEEYSPKTL